MPTDTPIPNTVLLYLSGQKRNAFIAKQLKSDLDRLQSSYRVRLLAPEPVVPDIEKDLQGRLGKRRSKFLRVESPANMLHRLNGDEITLTRHIHNLVCQAIARTSPELGVEIHQLDSLDNLLLDSPQSPIAESYLAGLQAMGVRHPFLTVNHTRHPVDLEVLYVFDFDQMPIAIQEWVLSCRAQGTRLLLTASAPPPSLVQETELETHGLPISAIDTVSEQRYTFPTPARERTAIVQACRQQDVDLVCCATPALQASLEIDCLLDQIPYRISQGSSVLHSETINALVAYLEWTVYEQDSALQTLLAMMGVSSSSYRRFASTLRLPQELSVAALTVVSRKPSETFVDRALRSLADLIFDSRMRASSYGRLLYFADWGDTHIPEFERTLLTTLIERSGIESNDISLADLKAFFYTAASTDVPPQVTIANASTASHHSCGRTWLAFGQRDVDSAAALQDQIRRSTEDRMIVSSVITDVHP